jgi:hypothetical protein
VQSRIYKGSGRDSASPLLSPPFFLTPPTPPRITWPRSSSVLLAAYATMDEGFEQALTDLGLEAYVQVFLNTGFCDWDSISSITEFDLEAVGMRLGDRRKLEREIARRRGWPDERALPRTGRADSSSGGSYGQLANSETRTTTGGPEHKTQQPNVNGKRVSTYMMLRRTWHVADIYLR